MSTAVAAGCAGRPAILREGTSLVSGSWREGSGHCTKHACTHLAGGGGVAGLGVAVEQRAKRALRWLHLWRENNAHARMSQPMTWKLRSALHGTRAWHKHENLR